MAKLTITGNRKYLEMIMKDNRSRSAKYNLEFSLEVSKAKERESEPSKAPETEKKAPESKSKSKKTK